MDAIHEISFEPVPQVSNKNYNAKLSKSKVGMVAKIHQDPKLMCRLAHIDWDKIKPNSKEFREIVPVDEEGKDFVALSGLGTRASDGGFNINTETVHIKFDDEDITFPLFRLERLHDWNRFNYIYRCEYRENPSQTYTTWSNNSCWMDSILAFAISTDCGRVQADFLPYRSRLDLTEQQAAFRAIIELDFFNLTQTIKDRLRKMLETLMYKNGSILRLENNFADVNEIGNLLWSAIPSAIWTARMAYRCCSKEVFYAPLTKTTTQASFHIRLRTIGDNRHPDFSPNGVERPTLSIQEILLQDYFGVHAYDATTGNQNRRNFSPRLSTRPLQPCSAGPRCRQLYDKFYEFYRVPLRIIVDIGGGENYTRKSKRRFFEPLRLEFRVRLSSSCVIMFKGIWYWRSAILRVGTNHYITITRHSNKGDIADCINGATKTTLPEYGLANRQEGTVEVFYLQYWLDPGTAMSANIVD